MTRRVRRVSRTTTTNFTKCRAFRDRARSRSFLGDERRADRKFRRDLRRSLARKSIAITGADRAARLISRTIYDGPAASCKIDRDGLPTNWESRIDLALRNAAFKSAAENDERSALPRKPRAGIAIANRDIFYALFAENSKRLSDTRE